MSTSTTKDKYGADQKRYNNFQSSTTNPYGTNYQRYYSPTSYQQPAYQSQVVYQQPGTTTTGYTQQVYQQQPVYSSQVYQQQVQQPVYSSQIRTSQLPSQVYQSYKGESRYQTIPIERKVVEYEQVPVEKTYVDQEVIEYQTEYVPRVEYDTYTEQVPVRSIEYVPVQRIDYVPQEKIDYVPQQRQVERVEYDLREVPVKRGVQQSQLPATASQVGQPTLSQSQVNYYPQYGQGYTTTTGYAQPVQYGYQSQYAPSSGAQVYGNLGTTAAKQQEYVKKDYTKDTTSKK